MRKNEELVKLCGDACFNAFKFVSSVDTEVIWCFSANENALNATGNLLNATGNTLNVTGIVLNATTGVALLPGAKGT